MLKILARKIWRRLLSLPADLALRLLNLAPVEAWLFGRYRRARARHAATLPALSAIEADLVDQLCRTGVAVTHLDALAVPGTDAMLHQAQAMHSDYARRALEPEFSHCETIAATPTDILARPEIFAWGASERVRRIVEAYIGLPVAYDGMAQYYSLADAREHGTRRWHRDREDRRVVKIAVYLNDVTDGGGPLQVLHHPTGDHPDGAPYVYPTLTQAQLERRLGADAVADGTVDYTGRAGTVVICDTARHYHRAKPATTQERGAVFFCYFSRFPRHPFFCERTGLTRDQISGVAKAYDAAARASTLWFEDLPWLARLLPRSRV